MTNVIALTQFVFLALGTVAMIVLTRVESAVTSQVHVLRVFLAGWGLLFLLIPAVWWCGAQLVLRQRNGLAGAVQASGVLIVVAIVALYGWLILLA